MLRYFHILILLLIAAPALAQEPAGCDKFKWPLDREKTLLASPTELASGGEMVKPLAAAVNVTLLPFAEAKLPTPPSRALKSPDSYAGFIRVPAPPIATTYRITLTQGAWIDVVQDGREVKSTAFSGATGCEGLRKSVKFDLAAKPFVILLSGTTAHAMAVVVTPD
jgi:hypothetical protein